MKTNLYAMHWIAQSAVPHLPAGAPVITTASVQAYEPSAILLDYATTKAGIVAYTKALAKQLLRRGSAQTSSHLVRSGRHSSHPAGSRGRR